MAVCFVTLLARARHEEAPAQTPDRTCVDYPSQSLAYAAAQGQLAYYKLLEEQGHIRIIRSREDLDGVWDDWSTPSTVGDSPPVSQA